MTKNVRESASSNQDPEYYTRYFSLSKPLGEDIFELLFVTKDQLGVISKITAEIAGHDIDILSITGANDPDIGLFVLTLFCDFAKADCTAEDIANEVRNLPFATKVDFRDAKATLYDGYHFPIKVMNKYRAILLRGVPLLEMEKHLQKLLGSAGASIMFEEGKTYAHAVMPQLLSTLPHASHEKILQNIVDGLRATGWGLFQFQKEDDAYQVSVRHPPRSEGFESMFFRGIAVGAAELTYDSNLAVRSVDYDEETDTLKLTLESIKKSPTSSHRT